MTLNAFKSRRPRNVEEIHTCIAMLKGSPFWDSAYDTLTQTDIVKVWKYFLEKGLGHIEITENDSYKPMLGQRYQGFHSCLFTCHITPEFACEIIKKWWH